MCRRIGRELWSAVDYATVNRLHRHGRERAKAHDLLGNSRCTPSVAGQSKCDTGHTVSMDEVEFERIFHISDNGAYYLWWLKVFNNYMKVRQRRWNQLSHGQHLKHVSRAFHQFLIWIGYLILINCKEKNKDLKFIRIDDKYLLNIDNGWMLQSDTFFIFSLSLVGISVIFF